MQCTTTVTALYLPIVLPLGHWRVCIRLVVRNRISCFNIIMYDNDNVYNIMILRRGALLMHKDNTISDTLAYCYDASRHECILRFSKRCGARIFDSGIYAYDDGEDHFSRKRIFFQQFWSGRNGINYSPRARWSFGYVHICRPLWMSVRNNVVLFSIYFLCFALVSCSNFTNV